MPCRATAPVSHKSQFQDKTRGVAYQIQEAYLNAHSETGGFNWAVIVMESSCSTFSQRQGYSVRRVAEWPQWIVRLRLQPAHMRVCNTGLQRKIHLDHLGQLDGHEIAAEGADRHGLLELVRGRLALRAKLVASAKAIRLEQR